MRFAWLRENSDNPVSLKNAFDTRLARMAFWAFNAIFWIFLLPFFTPMAYSTGFIIFTIIIGIRLVVNVMVNNVLKLTPDEFERFPFRIPS